MEQTLSRMLLKVINNHQTNWDDKLEPVLFDYHVAKHRSTGYSPFYRQPRLPIDVELFSSNDRLEEENADQYIERLLDVQDTIRECAMSSIKKAPLLGGTCFTFWVNISKTQFYLCFTQVLRVR